MPIKGLSEQKRLPRLGKIHLGIMKDRDGTKYPAAVDYFVCPPEVQAVFGEKPRELRVLIPVEEPEKWAAQYYRCYSRTRGLICKGDGEKSVGLVDRDTGDLAGIETGEAEMREIACPGRDCGYYRVQCKEVMNLQFLLPEVPGLGVWQIDTGSINSIRNINSAADLIRKLYGRVLHGRMISLLLTLEPLEVKVPGSGRRTVHVMNLRTRETLVDMMTAAGSSDPWLLPVAEGVGAGDIPEPDDEVPELIMPQGQPGELRERLWWMMTDREAMDWQEGTAYKFLTLQLKREIRSTADLTEEELHRCLGFLEESLP